jgi:hypothetical protein
VAGADLVAAFRDEQSPRGRVLRGPVSGIAGISLSGRDSCSWAEAEVSRGQRRRMLFAGAERAVDGTCSKEASVLHPERRPEASTSAKRPPR